MSVAAEPLGGRGHLRRRGGDEALAAEPWLNGHDHDDVQVVSEREQLAHGGARADGQARLGAVLANPRQRLVPGVVGVGRLDVEGHGLRLGVQESIDPSGRLVDHQVHVERQVGQAAEGRAHVRRRR